MHNSGIQFDPYTYKSNNNVIFNPGKDINDSILKNPNYYKLYNDKTFLNNILLKGYNNDINIKN